MDALMPQGSNSPVGREVDPQSPSLIPLLVSCRAFQIYGPSTYEDGREATPRIVIAQDRDPRLIRVTVSESSGTGYKSVTIRLDRAGYDSLCELFNDRALPRPEPLGAMTTAEALNFARKEGAILAKRLDAERGVNARLQNDLNQLTTTLGVNKFIGDPAEAAVPTLTPPVRRRYVNDDKDAIDGGTAGGNNSLLRQEIEQMRAVREVIARNGGGTSEQGRPLGEGD